MRNGIPPFWKNPLNTFGTKPSHIKNIHPSMAISFEEKLHTAQYLLSPPTIESESPPLFLQVSIYSIPSIPLKN
jgi:hypothetical protein